MVAHDRDQPLNGQQQSATARQSQHEAQPAQRRRPPGQLLPQCRGPGQAHLGPSGFHHALEQRNEILRVGARPHREIDRERRSLKKGEIQRRDPALPHIQTWSANAPHHADHPIPGPGRTAQPHLLAQRSTALEVARSEAGAHHSDPR